MRVAIMILVMAFLISCGTENNASSAGYYIIETQVKVKPGATQEVLELFKATNPALVADETDWMRATFSSVEEQGVVIVRAHWKNKESYVAFSSSDNFKQTMGQFAPYFAGKPEVTISEVLFGM